MHYHLKVYVTASIYSPIKWKPLCGKQKWHSSMFLVLWYWDRLLLKQSWCYIRKDSDKVDLQCKMSFASRVNKLNLLLLLCLSCLFTEFYEWNDDFSFVTLSFGHKISLIFKYILFILVLCCIAGVWYCW